MGEQRRSCSFRFFRPGKRKAEYLRKGSLYFQKYTAEDRSIRHISKDIPAVRCGMQARGVPIDSAEVRIMERSVCGEVRLAYALDAGDGRAGREDGWRKA